MKGVCSCCGFETEVSEYALREDCRPLYCEVCAASYLSRIERTASLEISLLSRSLGYVANMILEEIRRVGSGSSVTPKADPKVEDAKELAVSGLLIDGGHHKQWYLEQVLKALGYDTRDIREGVNMQGYDWEDGIAP